MVLHSDDCEDEFPGSPSGSEKTSDMPVDYSSCNGECTLAIYWIGFQNAQWQAYVNCVPLKGSGSSTTQTQTSTAGESTSEQSTPSTGTQSAAGSSTSEQSTNAPATSTQATQAPSTDTQAAEAEAKTQTTESETKCKAPSRRLRKKIAAL
ncbi:unnamed protein product [Phytophthora lilii]|uniref:Unnamed protein product n=1 Tax=Phytophthora lilii TaxID=2077276 RepID=A0A9W6WZM8_9STRA|nr:unnamed protein product [Phytophthora lilii]